MSSTRTHLALMNQDVLHEVFNHLSLFHYPSSVSDFHLYLSGRDAVVKRRTLASAALTCRAFADPASHALWAVLHVGLIPLLRTFSNVQKKEREKMTMFMRKTKEVYYDIEGEISDAERDRYEQLAARVRCLVHCNTVLTPALSDKIVERYRERGTPLLPNLRVLHWPESFGDIHRGQILQALCAPPTRLILFSLSYGTKYGYGCDADRDIAIVTDAVPHLAHFQVNNLLNIGHDSPLLALRHLRSLKVWGIKEEFYRHLSTLPCLEHLKTSVAAPSGSSTSLPFRGFHALRELKTIGRLAPRDILLLLSPIASPDLTALSLGIYATHSNNALSCIADVGKMPILQTLRQLELKLDLPVDAFKDGSGERMEIRFADLAHSILGLCMLEDVSVWVRLRTLSFDDDDVAQIKSAWPRLIRLSISFDATEQIQRAWQPAGVHVVRPSLPALLAFAESSPRLEELDVEVEDVSEADLAWLEAKVGVYAGSTDRRRSGLNRIAFAHSSDYRHRIGLPDLARLAAALRCVFPHLGGGLGQPILDGHGDGPVMYYHWSRKDMETDVFQLLKILEDSQHQV